jgi:hypothetical protein
LATCRLSVGERSWGLVAAKRPAVAMEAPFEQQGFQLHPGRAQQTARHCRQTAQLPNDVMTLLVLAKRHRDGVRRCTVRAQVAHPLAASHAEPHLVDGAAAAANFPGHETLTRQGFPFLRQQRQLLQGTGGRGGARQSRYVGCHALPGNIRFRIEVTGAITGWFTGLDSTWPRLSSALRLSAPVMQSLHRGTGAAA